MTKHRRTTRLLLALSLATAGLGMAGAHYSARASALELSGPHVISYEQGYPAYSLADSHREIRTGTRLPDGGCQFRSSGLAGPRDPAHGEVELAYDPDTCRDLVDVGVPTESANAAAPSPGVSEASSSTASAGGSGAGGVTGAMAAAAIGCPQDTPNGGWGNNHIVPGAPYSGNSCRAVNDTWYDEPARWVTNRSAYDTIPPVNEQLNFVEWTPDGSCAVTPGSLAWMGAWKQYLKLTGWYLVSDDWQHNADPLPCGPPVFSRSTVHVQNRAFCAAVIPIEVLFPTDVYYSPNYIEGRADAYHYWETVTTKSGLCGDTLLRVRNMVSTY